MSKYVKNLVAQHVRDQLQGVSDVLLVNVIGLSANSSHKLRATLRTKNIHLLVVKNSLAARAMEGTPLAGLFEDVSGAAAVCWGAEDVVSLAKEISRLADVKEYEKFEPRGGMMEGSRITAAQVTEVSKWPSRSEQLSLLVGQILGPGARLAAQLSGPGGTLVGQIKQKGEEEEAAPTAEAATEAAAEPAAS